VLSFRGSVLELAEALTFGFLSNDLFLIVVLSFALFCEKTKVERGCNFFCVTVYH
ncbi:hypothetical protein MNBD_GAMMA10-1370, partial [hydrothermal vent metagenome]